MLLWPGLVHISLLHAFRPDTLIHPLAAEGNVKDTPGLTAASASPLPLLLFALLLGAGELPGGPPGSSGGGLLNFASGPVRGTLGELLIFMSAGFAWKPALRMETCVGTTVIRDGACKDMPSTQDIQLGELHWLLYNSLLAQ